MLFAPLVNAVGLLPNAASQVTGRADPEQSVHANAGIAGVILARFRFFLVLLQLDPGKIRDVIPTVREVEVGSPAPAFQPAGNDEGVAPIVTFAAEDLCGGRGGVKTANREGTLAPGFVHERFSGNTGGKQLRFSLGHLLTGDQHVLSMT